MVRFAKQIVCLCIAGLASGAFAAPDVRILLDVSTAMSRVDPQNQRVGALEVTLRMLPREAHAGVWTYAQDTQTLIEPGRATGLWRETALIKLRGGLGARGQGTNLWAALTAADWDAASRGAADRHLVVVSAGGVSVPDAADGGASLRQRLLVSRLPELRAAGVRVHAVAVGESADRVLLEQLALGTGGYFAVVTGAEDLTAGLIKVIDHAIPPMQLPIAVAGTFRVDAGIEELTVLRLREQDDPDLVLQSPLGQRLSRTSSHGEVKWHHGRGYDLLSLRDPTPGDWRFRAGTRGNVRVTAVGDLSLDIGGLAGVMFPGGPLTFSLALASLGRQLTDSDFLDLLAVSATLQTPTAEHPVVVEAQPDGHYALHLLELAESGDHILRVHLQGPTFARQLAVPFVVRNPLTLEIRPAADGALLWVDVSAPGVDPATLQVAAKVRRPPGPVKVIPAQGFPAGLWKVIVPATAKSTEVSLDISGNYLNGKDFSLKSEWLELKFPVVAASTVSLDATGKQIRAALRAAAAPSAPPQAAAAAPAASERNPQPPVAPETVLPLWFVGLIGVLSLGLVVAFWWFLQPVAEPHALPARVTDFRELLSEPEAQPT